MLFTVAFATVFVQSGMAQFDEGFLADAVAHEVDAGVAEVNALNVDPRRFDRYLRADPPVPEVLGDDGRPRIAFPFVEAELRLTRFGHGMAELFI